MAHFHSKYRSEFKGTRSYSWVKTVPQGAGQARKSKARGKHRIKRERAPLPGMMVHQDASTHRWVSDEAWDLVVTMDDATGEHTSMFFCDEEGTASSFHGLGQTIARYGLFASLCCDRGSHYFVTPNRYAAPLLSGTQLARGKPTEWDASGWVACSPRFRALGIPASKR